MSKRTVYCSSPASLCYWLAASMIAWGLLSLVGLEEPFVAALVQKCIPDDPQADVRSFVFVATLSTDAQLSEIEVRPVTAVSKCFARGMERAPFPRPPAALAAGGMPIVLNMRLHEMN